MPRSKAPPPSMPSPPCPQCIHRTEGNLQPYMQQHPTQENGAFARMSNWARLS